MKEQKIKSRAKLAGTVFGLFLTSAILVFAANFILNKFFIIKINPGTVRSFDLTGEIAGTKTVVPGSEITVDPAVVNTGTDPVYAFIRFDCADNNGSPIYSFTTEDGNWTLVDTGQSGQICYAYGSAEEMTILSPSASKDLPGTLTMSLDNATFSTLALDGITSFDVKVMGCVIGTGVVGDADPASVYAEYISLGGE